MWIPVGKGCGSLTGNRAMLKTANSIWVKPDILDFNKVKKLLTYHNNLYIALIIKQKTCTLSKHNNS